MEVECSFTCEELSQRCRSTDHETEHCKKRPYSCDHCHAYDSTVEAVTELHYPQTPLNCPVGRLHSNDRNWGVFCRSRVPSPSLTAHSRRLVARPLPRKHMPEHMNETTAQLLLLAALQTKLKHHCSPFMLTSLRKKRSSRTPCSHARCLTFSLFRTAANRRDFTVLFYTAVLFRRTRAKAVINFLVVGSVPASSRRVGTRAGSSGWRLAKRTRPASRQSTASSLFCLCLFSAAPLVRCSCCRSVVCLYRTFSNHSFTAGSCRG